jgi:hypothetical protein
MSIPERSTNGKISVGNCNYNCDLRDLSLKFKCSPDTFETKWDFSDRLTKFIASYYTIYVMRRDYNSLLFIINELIENSLKYAKDITTPIEIEMFQTENDSLFRVTNEVTQEIYHAFVSYAFKFFNSDLGDLYRTRIEDLSNGISSTGIGLILLKKDYNVDLCFEFNNDDDKFLVSIIATL